MLEFFVIQCVIARYGLLDTCLRTIPLVYYLVLLFASAINPDSRRSGRRLFVVVLDVRPHDLSRLQLVPPTNPAHYSIHRHISAWFRGISTLTQPLTSNIGYIAHQRAESSLRCTIRRGRLRETPQCFTIVNMTGYEASFTQSTFADLSVVFHLNSYPQNCC